MIMLNLPFIKLPHSQQPPSSNLHRKEKFAPAPRGVCSIAHQSRHYVHQTTEQTTLGQIFLTSRRAFRGLGDPTKRASGLATPNRFWLLLPAQK